MFSHVLVQVREAAQAADIVRVPWPSGLPEYPKRLDVKLLGLSELAHRGVDLSKVEHTGSVFAVAWPKT